MSSISTRQFFVTYRFRFLKKSMANHFLTKKALILSYLFHLDHLGAFEKAKFKLVQSGPGASPRIKSPY